MKIIISGGTGFIGKQLVNSLAAEGHSLVLLTRNPSTAGPAASPNVTVRRWDGATLGDWSNEIDGADAVINFAGEPIAAKRWSASQKKRIIDSRINATRVIIEAMRRAARRPAVLVNASAVGFYGSVPNDEVTEAYKKGSGFLPDTCEMWEGEARKAESLDVRVVLLRTGIVCGEDGGALEKMSLPFKLFLGAPLGTGKQWFPWIHRDDVVGIVHFVLKNSSVSGPVNVAAPDPVTMTQFCQALARTLNRPCLPMSVPSFVLSIALGEMAQMLLTGQRIIPAKLSATGYTFRFPKLNGALRDIFS